MVKRQADDSSSSSEPAAKAAKTYKPISKEDINFEARKGLLMCNGGLFANLCRACVSKNYNLPLVYSEGYYRTEVHLCPTCVFAATRGSYGRYVIGQKDNNDKEVEERTKQTSETSPDE